LAFYLFAHKSNIILGDLQLWDDIKPSNSS
jgi:hypothetical protein